MSRAVLETMVQTEKKIRAPSDTNIKISSRCTIADAVEKLRFQPLYFIFIYLKKLLSRPKPSLTHLLSGVT